MAAPYKMKGSPMKRNFGIGASPMKEPITAAILGAVASSAISGGVGAIAKGAKGRKAKKAAAREKAAEGVSGATGMAGAGDKKSNIASE